MDGQKKGGWFVPCPTARKGAEQTIRDRFGARSATHRAKHIRAAAGSWRVLEPADVDGQKMADGLFRARPLGRARNKPSATAFERSSATHRAKHIRVAAGSWRALEPADVVE